MAEPVQGTSEPAPAPGTPEKKTSDLPQGSPNNKPAADTADIEKLTTEVNNLKAVLDGTTSSEDALLDALVGLRQHEELPTKVLQQTMIGKTVNRLAKDSPVEKVKNAALELVGQWRQTHRKRKASAAGLDAGMSRSLSAASMDSDVGAAPTLSQTLSQDSLAPDPTPSVDDTVKEAVKEGKSSQRKKVEEKLREALTSTDKMEIIEGSAEDEQDDTKDPAVLADEIEVALHGHFKEKEKDYLNQARAVLFNLKDKKNATFKFKLTVGFIKPDAVPKLTAVDMASDDKNKERRKDYEDAMAAIDQDWNIKKGNIRISGMFTCGKCKKSQTTYFQMQTRSSDEPMTTFVTCLNCSNRWKFC